MTTAKHQPTGSRPPPSTFIPVSTPEPNHLNEVDFADSLSLQIAVPQGFSVYFTSQVFSTSNPLLADLLTARAAGLTRRAIVFVDANVLAAWSSLEESVRAYFSQIKNVELSADLIEVPAGEAAKEGLSVAQQVGEAVCTYRLDRQSYILAIGGGAVLDAIGLGAALAHRGINLIRIPTTVLAQNDAGVGIKNGVNAYGQKNFFGCFALPLAVINDAAFLTTLDERNWRAGIAEAVKVSCIKDADFFRALETNMPAILKRDLDDRAGMRQLIHRCATLHLEHLNASGDPFEMGSARPLDFGHWSAHWLEMISGGEVLHGEAVAIGVALDTLYAEAAGYVTAEECTRVLACLRAAGFSLWHESLAQRDAITNLPTVLVGLEQFREHLGGELTLTFPCPLGKSKEIHTLDIPRMQACITTLQTRG